MQKAKIWLEKKEYLLIGLLVAFFILIRLPGTDLPLHQDEYKWPLIVNPQNISETTIPHPPLSQFIYRTAGQVVGYNVNFRFVPLFFGTINLLLLYYLVKTLFGKKEAVIASIIWILSYFSVLASLMVDTDGEILPFFFLLSLIGYYKLLDSRTKRDKYIFGALLVASSVLGFMVKVSFLLAVMAIAADYIWARKNHINKSLVLKYLKYLVGALVLLVSILLISQKVFPFFNLHQSFNYWEHFFVLNRGWMQTLIQCVKALLYTSPFLVLTPMFVNREQYSRVRVFIFFLIFSFVFYILLFDFSIGALDRYLQLLILPLTVLTTISISTIYMRDNGREKEFILLGVVLALCLIFVQSFVHYVPPLHPKSLWISRVFSLKWNFLYPFSGGSGPLGFYVSFLFIALSWFISIVLLVVSRWKKHYRKIAICIMIPVGLVYNGMFIEEYLYGYFNGSSSRLLTHAVQFIKNDPEIKMVTVYNDNGGNEIQEIGKYRKRLYVDPKFDINEKIDSLNKYKEHYFVLNVPRINPDTIYQKYFNSCIEVYKENDKSISATVYDCRNAPDIQI
jgi:hypothetical protein